MMLKSWIHCFTVNCELLISQTASLQHHSMIYNIWAVFLVSSLNQFQILIEFYHGLAHQFNDSML